MDTSALLPSTHVPNLFTFAQTILPTENLVSTIKRASGKECGASRNDEKMSVVNDQHDKAAIAAMRIHAT